MTPKCGYIIQPIGEFKVSEDLGQWVTNIPVGQSYTITKNTQTCNSMFLRVISGYSMNKQMTPSFSDVEVVFRLNYLLSSSLTNQQMYAGETQDFSFLPFTTSLSDASCAGLTYDVSITLSNS